MTPMIIDMNELAWAISALKSMAADLNHDNGIDAANDVDALEIAISAMETMYREVQR